jgi:hypothetical protein
MTKAAGPSRVSLVILHSSQVWLVDLKDPPGARFHEYGDLAVKRSVLRVVEGSISTSSPPRVERCPKNRLWRLRRLDEDTCDNTRREKIHAADLSPNASAAPSSPPFAPCSPHLPLPTPRLGIPTHSIVKSHTPRGIPRGCHHEIAEGFHPRFHDGQHSLSSARLVMERLRAPGRTHSRR